MPATEPKSQGTQPPPGGGTVGPRGHPLPRRTSPEHSVTLRHHRLARDSSSKVSKASRINSNATSSPRRNSSGESHDTGQSDPNRWFDQSNQNPTATFDNHTMDVDPPFFQKETDSSNEGGKSYYHDRMPAPPKLNTAQSSSADEYRSVIDDLTVEIQKLKDELKRHKQKGPDMLRKDKLFEIKIHSLPKRKKRELESTLRDFASGLGSSPTGMSGSRKNPVSSKGNTRDRMYSNSGSMSKHASSSSGSNTRPADSAYASMSTGAHSSGASLSKPSMSSRAKSSEQKVESYLRDIPEGLYPRHVLMTDKDKKKMIVKRLEQLFTGKITGRGLRKPQPKQPQSGNAAPLAAVVGEGQAKQTHPLVHQPPTLETRGTTTTGDGEPAREARILPPEQQSGKKSRSRDNGSASNSGGDQTESGGTHGGNHSGANTSPPDPTLPEQRPTRLKDLDPDRAQVPAENMEYIKHLGLVPPELLNQPTEDVHPDADGWVYLNLLCNLAQLHMINVTPDFVRAAVSGMSTKFQLSPDGRKIRWRGGTEGTRFSSDSSGDNAQHTSPELDDTDGSNKGASSKRQKTGHSTGDEGYSGSMGKNASKLGYGTTGSSESFHYKPLFVHQGSSYEQTSMDETLSSFGPVEDSNVDDSKWGNSGSGNTSGRKKRRRDGAIIYYSGAPFCTDLSGDPGDTSPMTYMMSSGQDQEREFARPSALRTPSGSSLSYRPLAQKHPFPKPSSKMDLDIEPPGLSADSGNESDDDVDLDMAWSDEQQYIEVHPLEPCGLGGVMPEDHFMVVVTTKRPKAEMSGAPQKLGPEVTTDNIISRLASMTTSSPSPLNSTASSRGPSPGLEIEYSSGRIKRLAPVRLPPPAIFYPPFSSDGSSSDEDLLGSEGDDELESDQTSSRRADGQRSDGYPDGVDLTSGDEDGEDPDDEPDTNGMYVDEERPVLLVGNRRQSSAEAAAGTSARGRSKSASVEVAGRTDQSSLATAGGVGSSSVGSSAEVSS